MHDSDGLTVRLESTRIIIIIIVGPIRNQLTKRNMDMGGFGGAKGAMAPQTPEVALCPMHYSLTVASYASLNPLSIQY